MEITTNQNKIKTNGKRKTKKKNQNKTKDGENGKKGKITRGKNTFLIKTLSG